jgi:hypothetical protein
MPDATVVALFSGISSSAQTVAATASTSSYQGNAHWPQTDLATFNGNLAAISQLATTLSQRYAATPSMSADYRKTLTIDKAALDNALGDATAALATVAGVRADLEAKVANGNVAGGATSNGPDIPVTVTTMLNQSNAFGYLVRLNCRADASSTSPEFVFNSPSNPSTTGSLPAGNYVLWLQKGTQHYSREFVTIAAVQGPTVSIIVDVVPSP